MPFSSQRDLFLGKEDLLAAPGTSLRVVTVDIVAGPRRGLLPFRLLLLLQLTVAHLTVQLIVMLITVSTVQELVTVN